MGNCNTVKQVSLDHVFDTSTVPFCNEDDIDQDPLLLGGKMLQSSGKQGHFLAW